jgi:hypothetical protein
LPSGNTNGEADVLARFVGDLVDRLRSRRAIDVGEAGESVARGRLIFGAEWTNGDRGSRDVFIDRSG